VCQVVRPFSTERLSEKEAANIVCRFVYYENRPFAVQASFVRADSHRTRLILGDGGPFISPIKSVDGKRIDYYILPAQRQATNTTTAGLRLARLVVNKRRGAFPDIGRGRRSVGGDDQGPRPGFRPCHGASLYVILPGVVDGLNGPEEIKGRKSKGSGSLSSAKKMNLTPFRFPNKKMNLTRMPLS
jgi:hypothetical protein